MNDQDKTEILKLASAILGNRANYSPEVVRQAERTLEALERDTFSPEYLKLLEKEAQALREELNRRHKNG